MNLKLIVEQDQRLVVLQLLNQDCGFSHNEFVLQEALSTLGHKISKDKLHTQLHWLSEQDLIRLTGDDVLVAKLTARGADVANGSVTVPGVKRPRP